MKLITYTISFIIIFQVGSVLAQSKILSFPMPTPKPKPPIEEPLEVSAEDLAHDPFPEKASPESAVSEKKTHLAEGKDFMIVTANPIATQAGFDVLSRGGTAADAAFTAQLVLGLVEPQSSGLGGGGFALYWDALEEKLTTYDGREISPASVTEDIFLDDDGKPMDFYEASIGGRAVGVPGLPALLDTIYLRHGRLPREEIFQPAFELSKYGFMASPRLSALVKKNKEHFRFFESGKDYFMPKGTSLKANENIINSDYNATLFEFKTKGAATFYTGDIAKDIADAVSNAWHNPGKMELSDLQGYKVIIRKPVCGKYRVYKVCSMGEPSSGGLTIIQALLMLQRFDLNQYEPSDSEAWHLILEASRMAFADRNMYMADPDIVSTPDTELINPAYVAVRSALISTDHMMESVSAGKPPNWEPQTQASDEKLKNTGTTHISAIDKQGNAISLTSSIETAFGSKMMVHGYLLNNQLTDFAFQPEKEGQKVANRAEPGKRPRSSMSPVIIFDQNNQPVMIIGSAGGSRIIGYVLQRIISVLDWNMPLDEAMQAPNILNRGRAVEIEEGKDLPFEASELKEYGHKVNRVEMNSGLTAIYKEDDILYGSADPRREGVAMGE